MKLILIRHGETHWNRERRVQGGDSDIELNEAGLNQAKKLAAFLGKENIAIIVSSPMRRAVATAEAIASRHGLKVEINNGLKELNVGKLEGLSLSNLTTPFSQFLLQWGDGANLARLPDGESLVELQQRAWKVIEPLLLDYKDGALVIVSHYFVTLTIVLKALDLPLDNFTKFKVDLGGVSILEVENHGTRLVLFNDTSY